MARLFTSALLSMMASVVSTQACGDHISANFHKRDGFEKRQATTYPTGSAYDVSPLPSITPTQVSYEENTLPVIAYVHSRPTGPCGAPHSLLVSHRLRYTPFHCLSNHPPQIHIITNSFPQIPSFPQHGQTSPSHRPLILLKSKSG
jgi:hypothetical protein